MRKYVPCVLVISFVFLLVPIAQAIRLSPDYRNAVAHFNLGNAYYNTGKYQEAIESYKQVIRIDPDYAVAHFNLGLAYHLLEDRSSALGQYVILKELDIELANELFDEIYRETDREPVPLVTIRQEPREVEAFNSNDIKSESKNARKLAEKEDKWSKWQKSLNTAYDEALKYDKDTNLNAGMKVEVWKRLANEFSQDNPYSTEDQLIRSKAVERMEYWRNYREPTPPETIRQEPSYGGTSLTKKTDGAVAHNKRGDAYYKSGKYQEAIESYKQAIRIDPDFAWAHNNLGDAYLDLNKKSYALDQYKILKELDSELANELFDEIYSE